MSTEFINDQWRLPNAWNGSESNVNKQSNYSMDFDGTGTVYITAGDSNSLSGAYNGYTISAWAKTPASWESDYNAIFTKKYSFYFGLNSSHYLVLNPGSGTAFANYEVTSTTALSLNTWYHFLVTADGINVKLYINGSLDKTQATTNTAQNSNTTNTPYIGGYSNSGDFDTWKGQLDAVCFFDYALTDGTGGTVNQIAALYGSSSTGIGNPMSLSPAPVAYYPLGDQDAFNGADYLTPNASMKDFVFDFENSSNQYISGTASLPNTDYTISAWINLETVTSESIVSWGEDATGKRRALFIWNGGAGAYRLYSSTYGSNIGGSTTLLTGQWYHAAVTVSSAAVAKIYLNGSLDGTGTNTLNSFTGTNFYIGRTFSGEYFDGKISNAQIFNTALPATGSNSVETLYNNGSPLTSMSGFTSLQGWWKLDASATYDSSTTTWTIPDDSSNSNDGTSSVMTQSALQQSDLSFKTSYSPYALDFSGITARLETYTIPAQTNTVTLSAWVKRTGNAGTNVGVFGVRNYGGPPHYGLCWQISYGNNDNKIRFRTSAGVSSAYQEVVQNDVMPDNTWHHVAGVADGTNLKIYINGALQTDTKTQTNGTLQSPTSNIFFAAQGPSGGQPFNGQLSNCARWNVGITQAEVTEIYNQGVPSNLNNFSGTTPIAWWQLGSNSSFEGNDWTCLDEIGADYADSGTTAMTEDDIVDGVGSYANGLSSGMGGDEIVGDAFGSSANSLSVNMEVEDRTTDTPS